MGLLYNLLSFRIDTCIVGEDSTCEKEKHEVCKTKLGVSSCFCKPGYGRRKHRQKCQSKFVPNIISPPLSLIHSLSLSLLPSMHPMIDVAKN